MKRFAAIIGLVLMLCGVMTAQTVVDSTWRADVKTVQLYRGGESKELQSELLTPVLTLGEREQLTLEFDVLGTEPEALRWSLRHCDRNWQPDDLEAQEFMSGFEGAAIEDYEFSFTTLTDYIHYRAVVPGRYASFLYSGNYALTVAADGDETAVLLTRRLCVCEAAVKVSMDIGKPYDGIDIDRRQEVDVTVESGKWKAESVQASIALRPEYINVMVQQNGRLDNRRWLEFSGYDRDGLAYRNRSANVFYGGNTFRFFDCSNLRSPMYNVMRVEDYGGEQFVMLRPDEDRSAKHYLSETTLNGGMRVNIWDRNNPRIEADYVWVNFCLPMAQPMLEGNVYVVGALTDWQLDSTALMEYSPQRRAYTKRLLLKQGYYSYQLLVAPTYSSTTASRRSPSPELDSYSSTTASRRSPSPILGEELDSKTRRLEGDHRETPNRYTVYVYQRTPADRADRLIGVTRRRVGQ